MERFSTPAATPATGILQAKLDGLCGELEQVRSERDDLRRRLDIADEERREKDRLLTALLTDQRHKAEAPPVKAGFRFFGLEIRRSRPSAS